MRKKQVVKGGAATSFKVENENVGYIFRKI